MCNLHISLVAVTIISIRITMCTTARRGQDVCVKKTKLTVREHMKIVKAQSINDKHVLGYSPLQPET